MLFVLCIYQLSFGCIRVTISSTFRQRKTVVFTPENNLFCLSFGVLGAII